MQDPLCSGDLLHPDVFDIHAHRRVGNGADGVIAGVGKTELPGTALDGRFAAFILHDRKRELCLAQLLQRIDQQKFRAGRTGFVLVPFELVDLFFPVAAQHVLCIWYFT